MLRHFARRVIRSSVLDCASCLLDPSRFFRASRYTHSSERVGENLFEVIFRWRKLGVTRYYPVRIRVVEEDLEEGGKRIVYEPVEDSPYWFRIEFVLRERSAGGVEVEARASMKAGLMADLLGRRDYARFVEELLDRGIRSFLEEQARKTRESLEARAIVPRSGASCNTCSLFDDERRYCYFLEEKVGDPSKPPCGGRAYVAMAVGE